MQSEQMSFQIREGSREMVTHPESSSVEKRFFLLKGSFFLATVSLVLALGGSPGFPLEERWVNTNIECDFGLLYMKRVMT